MQRTGHRQYGTDLPWIRPETFSTYDMTKEGKSSAPEFTLVQVERPEDQSHVHAEEQHEDSQHDC